MACGDYSFYPTNYFSGFYPDSMMRNSHADGFPATMHSGPAYAQPVVPMGTGLPGRVEESFIENIIRFNKGKVATFYFTYQGNNQWNARIYRGRIETAGRDHIIISDPDSQPGDPRGKRHLLLMANLDWVEFDEEVIYPRPEPPKVPLMTSV
ncbi:spore germination protein Q [Paenibacillus mucilaginosus]|uniref:spore coat protein GerQ n=1 Tax=Paenibacillus mucilaginosus TaxID=61624 RepID=UPI003D2035BB